MSLLVLVFGCGMANAAPQTVAADTPSATPAGTTFTIPAGWSSDTNGKLVVLAPPEGDLKVGLIDVEAKDADSAVAAGWEAFQPGFKRPLRLATPQSPYNGWEERHSYDYETSPNEKLVVTAYAWRSGANWLVVMGHGNEATAEKRLGQVGLIIGSARPKGYSRESFVGKAAHPLDAARIQTLKNFVADGMSMLRVPGVGLAFIDGGKVVYEGGIGVRTLGKPAKIDANTRFIAASNTKAMTTLLLARLVDEGKLRWDEPVVEAYPNFKLGDPQVTREAEIKSLICACTGMPREDFEWLLNYEGNTPASAMQQLGHMVPTSKFGEVFQYSNLMAAAAGFIGGSIAEPGKELGAAYDEAMQKKVFGPLGMTRTTLSFEKAMSDDDYARPHDVDIDGHPAVGSMSLNYAVIPARPAGGMWTTPHDLAQYVMMELAKGVAPNGKRLVSEANLMERRKPNVIVGEDVTYGMGLITDKRWGVTVIHHGGDLAGYHSDMMWLPDYGVGAVILTDSDPGYAIRGPLMRKLLEVMFDGKPLADAQLKAAADQLDADRKKTRERLVIPADSALTANLASYYTNPALGSVTLVHKGKDLVVHPGRHEWQSVVATRKNDDGSISLITISPTLQGFEWVIGEKDGKRTLITRDAQHEYVYTEAAK
ncbi:MAG TPA: serine hydrolase domain-containing protein [Rhizomicrobium sp.]|jgi:CubicO group peptidase (beta-lactamase class C family)